jgi:DMSO reductase family type II enzyme heme b subunit
LGDGPSALTLRDSSDIPIRPRSLVDEFFKGGEEPDALYRLIVRGLPGTPMPGFEAALKEEERWDLVAFLKSIRTKKPVAVVTDMKAGKTSRVPEEPGAPDWAYAPMVHLPLQPIWKRKDWPSDLSVKALCDGQRVAFLLEWEDKTADRTVGKVQDFLDAAAVMVPERPGFYPFIGMGAQNDPVRIWQWRGITEKAGPESAYGRVERDSHPWEEEPMSQPAHAAGNPLARHYGKALEGRSVLEYLAGGPGTLTFVKPKDQKVRGQGVWKDGKWKVVLVQDKRPSLWWRPKALSPGTKTPLTFAVWDGSAGDRNGQKSISQWINVEVQK